MIYYAASFSVVLIAFTGALLYRIMPIITEIRDMDSLNIPLYESAKRLYSRISADEMSIVLRKLFASQTPIQIVFITRPRVIRRE